MGEVERVRASFGSSFGHDLGTRVNGSADRQAKKHHQEDAEEAPKGDAIELHDDSSQVSAQPTTNLTLEIPDHLDLSA